MKHVFCYSGGESSALTAIEGVRRFGSADAILLNHDINPLVEDADIKRFKIEVAAYLGLPITFANMEGWDRKDQFDVVMEAQAFKVGNGTALCTNRLKTRPFEAWLKSNFPDHAAIIYYGFDKGEGRRIQRRYAHLASLGFETAYPLAQWPRTIQTTREIGIDPPLTYSTFKHANCVGCLKAGRQHWYVVYCLRPDVWARGLLAEDTIGYTIIKGVSLAELEPLFAAMKAARIEATEKIPSGTFWASVRGAGISTDIEPADERPCECAA